MPVARIQMPDGRIARIEVPEGTTPEQVQAYAEAQVRKADEFVSQVRQKMADEGEPEERFGERLDRELKNIPRQAGLTARSAIEGVGEFTGIFSNPIAYGVEKLTGKPMMTGGDLGTYAADAIGLPSPETPTERVVAQGVKVMTPVGGQAMLAGKGANMASGAVQGVAQTLARSPAAQLTGAAAGGTAGEYAKESGGGPAAQITAGLVGGFAGAALPGTVRAIGNAVKTVVGNMRNTGASIKQATAALNEILSMQGITLDDISNQSRAELIREMRRSMNTGGEVDPVVLQRIADYATVGAIPRRGNVTLDPVRLTQEKNIAKYGANSQDPNLQQLARTTKDNDIRLTQSLNELGADQADDIVTTGSKIKGAMQRVDAPRKGVVDSAYRAVRNAQGRYAELDRATFANTANDALDEKQLGHFLPAEARSLMNDIARGQNVRGHDVPFTVNDYTQLDTVLSGLRGDLYRKGDTRAALAVQTVRKALWNTPIESTAGEQAVNQYNKARKLASLRFKQIENNPAMIAALDDVAPDKFVQNYIIGSGAKANVRDVAALSRELKRVPEAFQSAKNQILMHLKDKALSNQADEVGNFSPSNFNKALKAIGDAKLRMFFSKKEMEQLKTIGRVASYEKFQPTGSAVNNSNTTAMAMGFLERLAANTVVAKVPILRFMASVVADQARGQADKVTARQALSPSFTTPPQVPSQYPNVTPLVLPAAMGQE